MKVIGAITLTLLSIIYSCSTPTPPPPPALHQSALVWDKGTYGPTVVFNVYRSTSAQGQYSKIGQSPSNSYTDKTVQAGVTYWYFVTAYDNSSKLESASSNVINTTVP